ncbi:hypothetical protein TNCV_2631571, partial [Trichonephila clavipes]
VRNSCLHLATGRTRADIEKNDLATTEREKGRNGREERGWRRKSRGRESRHGRTMYRNPVTSQYILDFKKCPIEAVSSMKTRPSSYGVLPSPAELGYERTDAVFFLHFLMNGAVDLKVFKY